MSKYDKDGFNNIGFHRLHHTAQNGDLKAVQGELKSGTDIDIESRDGRNLTPLRIAAANNSIEIVKFLVSKGANLNKLDAYRDTALIVAAYQGYEEIVKILLEAKADTTIKGEEGKPALDWAKERGKDNVASLLEDFEKIAAAPVAPPAPNPFAQSQPQSTPTSSDKGDSKTSSQSST